MDYYVKESQMSRPKVLLFLVCLVLALSSGVLADDYWPTWRGPQATGVALKSNPPVTWSEKENIKWKVKLPGHGLSSPIIWEDKIFFLTAISTEEKAVETSPALMAAMQPNQGSFGRGRGGRGGRMSRAPSVSASTLVVVPPGEMLSPANPFR